MPLPQALIVRAPGTNCEHETAFAWEQAGARARIIRVDELIAQPEVLESCDVLTIPGGFSFGDDLGAGRVFALRMRRGLEQALRAHVERGGLILGICNGFQTLAHLGLFTPAGAPATFSVTHNTPAGYLDRWVTLRAADDTRCAFLEPGRTYRMSMAHGEGRVVFRDADAERAALAAGQGALRYVDCPDFGRDWPANPNGSMSDLAGVCDETGRVFGLMPHPERALRLSQHPAYAGGPDGPGDGLAFFETAVANLAGQAEVDRR